MEESAPWIRWIERILKVRGSGGAYRQFRGRIQLPLEFRRNEVHGLKEHLRPDVVTPLPILRNEGVHLVVSLVQPLRGHRVLQVEPTFLL